ncbi:hypothetical protein IF650_03665 [Cellulosimicrobium terreum]|nr:hypothetical protein [Cellulosimicrobium terreum]
MRPPRRARVVHLVRAGLVPVLAVGALAACSGTAAQSAGDYAWYEDVGALVDESDLVVVGTSVASRPDVALPEGMTTDDGDLGVPITVHTVEVADVLAGDAPGDTVEVGVARGSAEDGRDLGELGEVLLFLVTADDGPAFVVGGPQGTFVAGPDGWYASDVEGLPALETTPADVHRLADG